MFWIPRSIGPASARPHGWLSILTAGLFLLVGLGCSSPGRLLSPSAIQQLHNGQDRAEVLRIFGEPDQITKGPDNRTLLLYRRFDGPTEIQTPGFITPAHDDAQARTLTVLLTPEDHVEKFLFSESRPNVSRRVGRVGRSIPAASLGRIVAHQTTRPELIAWFGPPFAEVLTVQGTVQMVWIYSEIMAAGIEQQVVEVLVDDQERVVSFRQTKRDPQR